MSYSAQVLLGGVDRRQTDHFALNTAPRGQDVDEIPLAADVDRAVELVGELRKVAQVRQLRQSCLAGARERAAAVAVFDRVAAVIELA